MITKLPSVTNHPVVAELFPPSIVGLLLKVWEHRYEMYQVLDALPQSICHQDLFPRNAFVRVADVGSRRLRLTGRSAAGLPSEPSWRPCSGHPSASSKPIATRPTNWNGLCLDAYLEGLRLTGWEGLRDDVFVGYLATIVLRFMVGTVGPLLTFALDDSLTTMIEQIFGQPKPVLIARWRKINAFDEPRLASLLTTLGYA